MPLYIKNNKIISSNDITSGGVFRTRIPKDRLKLHLDAGDIDSYSGSGSVWYDLSGNGYNFTINSSAYNSSGPKYMDFNGSYGCAKIGTDVPISGDVTCVCWTRIKNSTAEWRTLLRGLSSGADHQVIVQSGGWAIGMYDNTNGTGFNNSGLSQQSLPGYGTSTWVFMVWTWHDSEKPYYVLSYNNLIGSTNQAYIVSANSRFKHGFCSIGAYNNGNQTDPNTSSQPWGDIGMISLYDRVLNGYEMSEYYQATRGRFGL
jgi:hypothetical protein